MNKYNPIANLYNAISGYITGYDSYGVPSDLVQSTNSLICAIPFCSIEFKTMHVTEHLLEIGLSSSIVENAIAKNISTDLQNATSVTNFWGRVSVQGQLIEYRAYLKADGTLNVGTYYLAK